MASVTETLILNVGTGLPKKFSGNPLLTGTPAGPDHDILYGSAVRRGAGDWLLLAGVANLAADLNSALYTSTDGLAWTRPNLGQVSYNGSTANNLLHEAGEYNSSVTYDAAGPTGQKFLRVLDAVAGVSMVCMLYGSEDGVTWDFLADLSGQISQPGEGGCAIRRADGRVYLLYEVFADDGIREFHAILSDTPSPFGAWTNLGLKVSSAGPDNQVYHPVWIGKVAGMWAGLFCRFNVTTQRNWTDLFRSTDEGATWALACPQFVPNGPAGAWDSGTIFGASLVWDGSLWRVYYCGGTGLHNQYPRGGALGYATLRDHDLKRLLGV